MNEPVQFPDAEIKTPFVPGEEQSVLPPAPGTTTIGDRAEFAKPPMTWPESEEDRKFDRSMARGLQLLIIAVSFMFGCGITATWNHSSKKPSEPVDLEGIHADISNLETAISNINEDLQSNQQFTETLFSSISSTGYEHREQRSAIRNIIRRLSMIESELRKAKSDDKTAADFPECE